jgi:hypothetical protein
MLSLLGLVGPLSIIVVLIVMAQLSHRLGAVTKRAPLYRAFYVSAILIGFSILSRVLSIGSGAEFDYDLAVLYDVPLVIGLVLGVIVAWNYWSWLLSERGKGI